MRPSVYLDNNSTTPMDPRVLEEMLPYYTEKFGNASSHQHRYGWIAEDAVDQAKERISSLLESAEEDLIVFTSGATESINLVLKGIVELKGNKKQIITTSIEHKAVLETLEYLHERGGNIHYLPVNSKGLIDINQLEEALRKETLLVCLMMANNETGVIQPMEDIISMVKSKGVPFFTDASQAFGKIPISLNKFSPDFMAFSGHKIYGPKGIGGLIIKNGNSKNKFSPQIIGGGQQNGLRSGTLNIPGIVGLGMASKIAEQEMMQDTLRLASLRDQLEKKLLEIPISYINGDPVNRLPQVSNIRFDYIRAEQLLSKLPNIALSTGSACNSLNPEPSHVLLGMGISDSQVRSSIRISLGRMNCEEDINIASREIVMAIEELREENPLWKLRAIS